MISFALALAGFFLLCYRLNPWRKKPLPAWDGAPWPKVSLIIPARNEAKNLPRLLDSLMQLDYPDLEILLVDDRSDDDTAGVAGRYPIEVIRGQDKPEGWFGKPWACHQGSLRASGSFLLFTDADTLHHPQSLKKALTALQFHKAQGLTAIPFHLSPSLWERLLGPFQILLLALTHPYGPPKKGRLFAIGQYLLFDRRFYQAIGGHESIKAEAVDDLSLAERTLAAGGRWQVYGDDRLYDVRMYETISEFIKGWRRNFRGGMSHSSILSNFEVVLFFMALTIGGEGTASRIALSVATLVLFAIVQIKLGEFSIVGVLLFPFSILLFITASALAVFDKLLARPLIWKNRSYL